MIAAYQCRAFPQALCDVRLGPILAAGVAAVENAEVDESEWTNLQPFADQLEIPVDDIQSFALLSDRQKERVHSLASNMTRR